MSAVTTNQILADKSLSETCGQQCVDWAIGMIEAGHDGHYLMRLAGMLPPFNHFEIAEFRDKTLAEMDIKDVPCSEAITKLFQKALKHEVDIFEALVEVSGLCIANDYQRNIMDFYLLENAYSELQFRDVQWYWDGATHDNIQSIIVERAKKFVDSNSTSS
jgi:hypothetical protein